MTSNSFSRRRFLSGSALTMSAFATPSLLSACGTGSGSRSAGGTIKVGLASYSSDNGVDPATGRQVKGVNELLRSLSEDSGVKPTAVDINADDANARNAKIQTLLLSGGVDIVQSGTLYPFFEQDLLIDLTDYYKQDNWADNFMPAVLTPPMERIMYPPWDPAPTKYISSPGVLNILSLAYDKQLFDDFKVEPLSAVPTIEEILEKLPKLTGTNPRTGKKSYGMYYDPRSAAHIMLYYFGHGIDLGMVDPTNPSRLRFNTPEVKHGIEQMIATAKYAPPGFEIGQGGENWGTEDNTVAINMSVSPIGMRTAMDNKLVDRFVVTEGVRNKENHTFFVSATEFGIAKKCKNPDAAWEVIKLLSGADGQKFLYEQYSELPTWKSADWVKAETSPYAKPFLAAAAAGKNAFFPVFMFRTFRPWMAATVSNAINGKPVNLDAGLADQQKKAEQWAKEQKTS